jgi:hypothetical protein
LLHPEDEGGRLQHRLDYGLRPFQELVFSPEDCGIPGDFLRFERAAKCAPAEGFNKASAARRFRSGDRFARDQAVNVAAPESFGRNLLRGRAIQFRHQRGNGQSLILIPKAVNEIFGRKIVRGVERVLQKIANGVVVLAVRHPPQHRLGCNAVARRFLLVVPQRGRKIGARKFRQIFDPRFQYRFFRTILPNPLAADVRNARSRLQKKQRFLRVLAIDQLHQRSPERLDPWQRRIAIRKTQARRRGHSRRIMAIAGIPRTP